MTEKIHNSVKLGVRPNICFIFSNSDSKRPSFLAVSKVGNAFSKANEFACKITQKFCFRVSLVQSLMFKVQSLMFNVDHNANYFFVVVKDIAFNLRISLLNLQYIYLLHQAICLGQGDYYFLIMQDVVKF